MAALSQLFLWFLNDESIGLLASFVTWISQMPQFVLESEIPKVYTKPNLYLLFTRMLDFFFIKILFTTLLAYTFTTQKIV